MEQLSAIDINSLIQSHIELDDSDDDEYNRRSVDEIMRYHDSSSPSPPSSPSTSSSTQHYFRRPDRGGATNDDVVLTSFRRVSRSYSSALNEYDKPTSASGPVSGSNRISHAASALPIFFGGGIGSNAKPGAALAAAVAASREIATPHANAIKLRRAHTAGLQKGSVSETNKKIISCDDLLVSPLGASSRVSLSGSGAGTVLEGAHSTIPGSNVYEEKKAKLETFPSEDNDPETEDTGQAYSIAAHPFNNSAEAPEVPTQSRTKMTVEEDDIQRVGEDCTMSLSHSQHMSPGKTGTDFALEGSEMNEKDLSCLFDGKNEDYPEGLGPGEHNPTLGLPSNANLVGNVEDTSGCGKASDTGIVMSQTRKGDRANSHTDGADVLEDFVSQPGNHLNVHKDLDSYPKPLECAEEIEKKQAFTGLHYAEGAAALPMRLQGLQSDSTPIGYFDVNINNAVTRTISSQAYQRDNGSPQVVDVHYNYIAVGMSKGSILVWFSKYTPHCVDEMDAKMIRLSIPGDRSQAPVTSLCFNPQGDLLFSGYGDGHYVVWDMQKASALKVINEHKAPIVHLLYMGSDTQMTRQFNVVSGDSKGVVKSISFSFGYFSRISITKTVKMKFLDETTSRVLCASALLYDEGPMSAQSSIAASTSTRSTIKSVVEEGVVIFITHQSATVAKVSPNPEPEVYTQIPKPDDVREGAMPYAAWKCTAQSIDSSSENSSVETSDRVSLLAIAWDRTIQVAELLSPNLKVVAKWTVDSPAIGLAWLTDQILAILTSNTQLHLFAKDGNLIHKTSFSVEGFRGNDLISYHRYFTNAFGNPQKAYHNGVAVRGASIYVLGSESLIVCRLLSWKERIEVLQKAGDWEGALNTGMSIYDGELHGVLDLPRNLDDAQRIVMPYLVELLHLYIKEVFSYISVTSYSQDSKLDQSDEIKDQYIRAGGVAVEFCVHIRRTDVLFDDIMSKFDDAHQKETFLEILEPYILKDMLGSLPPAIMQALVENYSKKGWLERIEQCILHMDIVSLDFNQVVRLCREHGLHCALIYLFNKGLDDFRTPLEELLAILQSSRREDAPSLGYRMLVYLKYCFQGLAFPPGRGIISPVRLPSLRKELLHFLLDGSSVPNSWAITSLKLHENYANLLHLLELDTEATLEVLQCAFVDAELPKLSFSSQESKSFGKELAESRKLVQNVVNILCSILDAYNFQTVNPVCSNDMVEVWPSNKDVCYMYDFVAYYVACEEASISTDVLGQILEYLTSEIGTGDASSGKDIEVLMKREKKLLSLLHVVPETHWDNTYLLRLSKKAQFHQVCGYVHAMNHQYVDAMDSYMKVVHEPIHAFSFIHDSLRLLKDEEYTAFESAVISRIPDLVRLCREGAYILIIHHLWGKNQYILFELRSQPESLFLYLKTVIEVQITGTLNLSCLEKVDMFYSPTARGARQETNGVQAYLDAISGFEKLLHNNQVNMTDEMMELYFETGLDERSSSKSSHFAFAWLLSSPGFSKERKILFTVLLSNYNHILQLLCRYDSGSVLKFLQTSENYRLEHCLRLCQEYAIVDAATFLLERVGEVGSALLLNLSNLGSKFVMLNKETQKESSDGVVEKLDAIMKKQVVTEIVDIMNACIGLCQRNSPRLKPEESESLWFQLLDSFLEPLMDSGNDGATPTSESFKKDVGPISVPLGEETQKFKWNFCNRKGSHIVRKLFSIFIKEIVEGMIGHVQLPRIMLKLLSEGNQEFGDVKLTVLGMLGTYDFERRILDTAKCLIEDDTYYMMSLLRKGASHGYAPRSLVCCICNSVFAKNSSNLGIQVFSCGHAMHFHCDIKENVASYGGLSVGCPICLARKKAHGSSSKSPFTENGLVRKPLLRAEEARATPTLHRHDRESMENSYGLPPHSRFELLHNLEKDQKLVEIENVPQLRLAPPALYNEKVKKGITSGHISSTQTPSSRLVRDVKLKGPSLRFPLKSNIFSKDRISRR